MESHSLLRRVNLLSFCFVHGDLSLLVPGDVPGGLNDTPWFECPDRDRGEKRGKEEVVSGGDDNDVVFVGVEILEEGRGTPTGSQDNQRGLGRIVVKLVSGVVFLLSDCGSAGDLAQPLTIDESARSSKNDNQCETSKALNSLSPPLSEW